MEFLPITEKQFDNVRRAVSDTTQVMKAAQEVMLRLKKILDEDTPKEYWGSSIHVEEGVSDYRITTPFGDALGTLALAVGESGVYGRLLIRKKAIGLDLSAEYPVVWSMRVTSDGRVYQGDSLTNPSFLASGFRSQESDNALVALALSLIYAIGAG